MSNNQYRLTVFIIIAVCIAIYSPGLHGPLLLDSSKLFALERVFHSPTEASIQNISFNSVSGRIFSQLTFYINIVINNGLNSFSIKSTNLALHIINGLLVLFLIKLLFRNIKAVNPSAIATLTFSFWMLSPVNMSSVLYSIQRMNQLATLFTLLCLIIFLWIRLKENLTIKQAIIAYSLLFLSCISAYFSKENAILIPLFILLIELFIIRKTQIYLTKNQIITGLITLTIIIAISLFIINSLALLDYQSRHFSLYERLLTETRVISIYLSELILPRSIATGLYNDGFAISKSLINPISTLLSVLFIGGLVTISVFGLLSNKYPLFCFGILFFFCGHLLESTLFPLEIYYEHRNYLPSVGIYFSLAILVFKIIQKTKPFIHYALITLYISLFTFIGFSKSTTWSNEHLAFSEAMNKDSISPRAYANLAQNFLNNNQPTKSIKLLQEIISTHEHQALRSRLQILFTKCQANISITKNEYQDLTSITFKELDIEISQALNNIVSLHQQTNCNNLNIEKLKIALQDISTQLQKINKPTWHIDFYRIQLDIHSGNLDQAILDLEASFSRGQTSAGHYLKHLIKHNNNLSILPETQEKLKNLGKD